MKWWAASLLLIAVGAFGLLFVHHSPRVGPTIHKPVGEVSLPPSGIVVPATTTTTVIPVTSPTVPVSKGSSSVSGAVAVGVPVARSIPVHLSIPDIGVSTSLSELGLNRDGSVQVPTNFAQPGWYKYDVTPGELGSAVILGHVDNRNGPAVFFRLNELNLGSRIFVTLRDGQTLEFAVIGVRMYSKTSFPDQLVYGKRNYPALQLVTCGGTFDATTGHYLSNIVVFTALVKT